MVSWGPYTVTSLMFAIAPSAQDSLSVTSSALVAKCSTIWNPIIYVATNTQFRNAFLKLCCSSKFNQTQSQLDASDMTSRTNASTVEQATNDVVDITRSTEAHE